MPQSPVSPPLMSPAASAKAEKDWQAARKPRARSLSFSGQRLRGGFHPVWRRTFYVDDDASGPVGVLLFHLELGHELTAADRNGLSDPYCIVKVAQNPLWRSRICRRTLEPNWDQLHAFEGFLRVCRDRARTADWL